MRSMPFVIRLASHASKAIGLGITQCARQAASLPSSLLLSPPDGLTLWRQARFKLAKKRLRALFML